MKEFTVKFSLCDSEYLTALRLVAGAVCNAREIDLDALEDFKVCVTECANILKSSGFESIKVVFSGGEKVGCDVYGEGGNPSDGDNELSLALISALVGDFAVEKNGQIIKKLSITL